MFATHRKPFRKPLHNMSPNAEKKTKHTPSAPEKETNGKPFTIPFPSWILAGVVLLLYAGSLNFGFTELDDSIFIRERAAYNAETGNLVKAFQQGVFHETNDTYFRPLLLDSFIINAMFSETEIKGYHAMNLLFHLVAVLLLFQLFRQLKIAPSTAFLLTLLYAVHPVLSQAVVWIPGRNDTMLAVFSLSFMLMALRYSHTRRWPFALAQFILLLAALFTKESAVAIPVAFFALLICMTDVDWKGKTNIILYGSWLLAGVCWLAVRSMATVKNDPLQWGSLLANLPRRSLLSVQYLGKIFLPFNLSVFPMQNQTSYLFGAIAIVALAALLYFSTEKNMRVVIGGLAWFFILLLPVFLLPASLNEQDFEHRLYLPIVGILLVLPETMVFKNGNMRRNAYLVLGVCVVFAVLNLFHQDKFKDPVTFWSAAVETTPESGYATMMLAARIGEKDKERAHNLMQRAYRLNPKEKYINYYLGKEYLEQNQVDSAEHYLLQELTISKYYDTYFLLSRLYFLRKDLPKSISYLEQYMAIDPALPQAINNYLLMLADAGQFDKAKAFIAKKRKEGISVNSELINMINSRAAAALPQ